MPRNLQSRPLNARSKPPTTSEVSLACDFLENLLQVTDCTQMLPVAA